MNSDFFETEALLGAVKRARGKFTLFELGAGYGLCQPLGYSEITGCNRLVAGPPGSLAIKVMSPSSVVIGAKTVIPFPARAMIPTRFDPCGHGWTATASRLHGPREEETDVMYFIIVSQGLHPTVGMPQQLALSQSSSCPQYFAAFVNPALRNSCHAGRAYLASRR